jgi:hypothetical protein
MMLGERRPALTLIRLLRPCCDWVIRVSQHTMLPYY